MILFGIHAQGRPPIHRPADGIIAQPTSKASIPSGYGEVDGFSANVSSMKAPILECCPLISLKLAFESATFVT
jgi:hypothetical protein